MRNFKHPLALLRFVVDMTQAEFGAAIGVSESYIKAFELGQRSITPSIIEAIVAQFGVDPEFLERPLPENENQLKSTMFFLWQQVEHWQSYFARAYNLDAKDVVGELLLPQIQALVDAASEKGSAIALLMNLDRWLVSTAQEFGLLDALKDAPAAGREAYAVRAKEVESWDPFHGFHFTESRNWKENCAEARAEMDLEKEVTIDALREWMKSEDFTGVTLDAEYLNHVGPMMPTKVAQFLGSELGSTEEKKRIEKVKEIQHNVRKKVRGEASANRKPASKLKAVSPDERMEVKRNSGSTETKATKPKRQKS